MKRIYYLEPSHCSMNTPALREHMRRHHWRQYFLALRRKDTKLAEHHLTLAKSLEEHRREDLA